MHSVTAGGFGLVAVGGTSVWISADGLTWSRVPHDEAVFGGAGAQMSSVTAGQAGLVAVGSDGSFPSRDAAVWTSVAGVSWSRVSHDEAVFSGAGEQVMSSVTVGGPGLVAVGRDGSSAAVWTSVDGLTWSRVPHDEAVFGGSTDQRMNEVTVGGPGLVALGEEVSGGDSDTASVDVC